MSKKCFTGCGHQMTRAIVSGLPAWVCLNEVHDPPDGSDAMPCDHGWLFGWLTAIMPFDGMILPYEGFVEGWTAWWHWLWHPFHDDY